MSVDEVFGIKWSSVRECPVETTLNYERLTCARRFQGEDLYAKEYLLFALVSAAFIDIRFPWLDALMAWCLAS